MRKRQLTLKILRNTHKEIKNNIYVYFIQVLKPEEIKNMDLELEKISAVKIKWKKELVATTLKTKHYEKK